MIIGDYVECVTADYYVSVSFDQSVVSVLRQIVRSHLIVLETCDSRLSYNYDNNYGN